MTARKDAAVYVLLEDPGEWLQHRACADIHPDVFFPTRGGNAAIQEAKLICHGCPVEAECLAYALTAGPMLSGVWGGTSQRERVRMLRARRKAGIGGGDRLAGRPHAHVGGPDA